MARETLAQPRPAGDDVGSWPSVGETRVRDDPADGLAERPADVLLDPPDRLQFERFHQWLRLTFVPTPLLVVLAHGPSALPQALLAAAAVFASYGWVWLLLRRWPLALLRWQLLLRAVDCLLVFVVLLSIHAFLGDAYYDSVYLLFVVAAAATHGVRGVRLVSVAAGAAVALGRAQLILAGVMPFELRHVTDTAFYAIFFVTVGGAVAYLMRRSGAVVARREQAWRGTLADRNAALERTATQLEATNRELEAFAYSVSHDLRAPLRAIDGFSQVLLQSQGDRLDARGRDYLGRVRAASQRMGNLIDDLLQLSRVTRAEVRREPVDLSALAEGIAEELSRGDLKREVTFQIRRNVHATGDTRLLRVLLENLLGNAWKFTARRERPRIELGVALVDGAPSYYVRDDGAGFDMAYADKLFGAFQRLHTTDEFEGTGVGLATVQRIVQKHGGRIWADAAIDRGATFYFTLGEGS
jgi:signal transduction histidine kinase